MADYEHVTGDLWTIGLLLFFAHLLGSLFFAAIVRGGGRFLARYGLFTGLMLAACLVWMRIASPYYVGFAGLALIYPPAGILCFTIPLTLLVRALVFSKHLEHKIEEQNVILVHRSPGQATAASQTTTRLSG